MTTNDQAGHAVVTGGGTGIGLAIAKALAARGHAVTIMGRSIEVLARASASLDGGGCVACDVTDDASVAAALEEAEAARGPVRVLVNNAGQVATAAFEKTGLDAWSAALDVNLLGAVRMIKAALPSLKSHDWARVINIASTAGLKPYAYVSAYVASKHALVGLTRALALELATTGVTVNAVCPGYTRTAIIERAIETIATRTGRGADAAEAVFTGANPQGRLVTPDEVASAVAWLASPQARAVNGVALSVSGGETPEVTRAHHTDAADATPHHKQTLRLWLRLLGCSTLMEKAIRARLTAEFDTTLPRFDVMAALERAPQGLQLGELSRALLVSNGNVTGIIARLVAEGLVDRRVDKTDARVARVSLTPAGRSAFLTMAAAHETWIEGMFDGLEEADQVELMALLTRLRRSLAAGGKAAG